MGRGQALRPLVFGGSNALSSAIPDFRFDFDKPCLLRRGLPAPDGLNRYQFVGVYERHPPSLECRRTPSSRFRGTRGLRSEEHTSELQSLTNLVCRLLLEKKKKTTGDYMRVAYCLAEHVGCAGASRHHACL